VLSQNALPNRDAAEFDRDRQGQLPRGPQPRTQNLRAKVPLLLPEHRAHGLAVRRLVQLTLGARQTNEPLRQMPPLHETSGDQAAASVLRELQGHVQLAE